MNDQEKMTKMMGELMGITDPTCLKNIANTARSRREALMQADTLSWQTGDKVQLLPEYQGKRPFAKVGTIVKPNTVKVKVDFGGGVIYNVPRVCLRKVK